MIVRLGSLSQVAGLTARRSILVGLVVGLAACGDKTEAKPDSSAVAASTSKAASSGAASAAPAAATTSAAKKKDDSGW